MSIIIWGSTNCNARNVTATRGTCEACGHSGYLTSYDTSRFFTLYFIPMVPLGAKHVIGECPKCKRGRMIARRKWNQLKTQELEPAIDSFNQNPADVEAAQSALAAVTQLAENDRFQRVAQQVAEQHVDNAAVLAGVGAACAHRLLDQDARDAFEASLAIDDDPEVREALGVQLLHTGQVDAAKPHIDAALAARGSESAGLLLLFAEAYQVAGNHEAALATFDDHAHRFADHAAQHAKHIDTRRKLSQRNLKKGRPVASPHVAAGQVPPQAPGWIRRLAPVMVLPAILLSIFGVILLMGFTKQPEYVYLVNGLDQPYEVLVNGKQYALSVHDRKRIKADYGPLSIAPVAGGLRFDPATIDLHAPFSKRTFGDPTFVINPDRTALLVWEKVQYAENPTEDGEYQVYINEPYYAFNDLDFRFRELPDEVKISSGRSVWRQTIQHLNDYSGSDVVSLVSTERGVEAVKQYLRLRLDLVPDDDMMMRYVNAFFTPDEVRDFVEPRRGDRPVRVHWHRAYQDAVEQSDPKHDLAQKYRRYFEAERESGDLAYLVGRVTADPDAAAQYYRQAVSGATPSAFGHYGLAYAAMAKGDFSESLHAVRQAIDLGGDDIYFQRFEREMRLAVGDVASPIAEVQSQITESPHAGELVLELIKYQAISGNRTAAIKSRDDFLKRLRDANSQVDDVQYWKAMSDSVLAQVATDPNSYLKALEATGYAENWPFQIAMVSGDWQAAAKMIEDEQYVAGVTDHLLLYAGLADSGLTELAQTQLEQGTAQLHEQAAREHALADWLSGAAELPLDAASRLPWGPNQRRVALVALAIKFPQRRDDFLRIARKMDYDPVYPHLVLAQILNAK